MAYLRIFNGISINIQVKEKFLKIKIKKNLNYIKKPSRRKKKIKNLFKSEKSTQ